MLGSGIQWVGLVSVDVVCSVAGVQTMLPILSLRGMALFIAVYSFVCHIYSFVSRII